MSVNGYSERQTREWVQSVHPASFVPCPCCMNHGHAPCPECIGTRKVTRPTAEQFFSHWANQLNEEEAAA